MELEQVELVELLKKWLKLEMVGIFQQHGTIEPISALLISKFLLHPQFL